VGGVKDKISGWLSLNDGIVPRDEFEEIMDLCIIITEVSITEQKYCSENLLQPLFTKEGEIPPFRKACLPVGRGGKEGFNLQCLRNY
jgi:hypothetical protein